MHIALWQCYAYLFHSCELILFKSFNQDRYAQVFCHTLFELLVVWLLQLCEACSSYGTTKIP